MIQTIHVLWLSTILFVIGTAGVLIRRNAIVMLMSVELMLNAVNLALIGFSRQFRDVTGQVYVIFIMTVAAAEVAIGLALFVAVFRHKRTLDTQKIDLLRW
ncbi:MAG TPA: NADH-quinone oxidoreductase subunit NuoK [Candidatus Latescibacteria bacterium]|nr:NADH-quinone oxidoreductase subunit NuoK [Candidatus Latescibacterota bacterium]HOF61677.1 NADH-quinone oxidoreductase subunit NuoK [Candidatus Latescibacterota bacterium]HOS64432.1 NADH-quinone oxidoreductase subunit NuoK [Candidatus Latescibacterota bacterium]HPK75333.1 NADH-quinone oxidoreductase subunit NuoK [Candidatus Latescibacterota bacterium]